MKNGFWAVAFICFVVFILFELFKIARLIWKRSVRLLHKAFDKTIAGDDSSNPFPKEAFPTYEIGANDFARIAYKVGYKHPRTEEILVDGTCLRIRFTSQSGMSSYDATVVFELSGRNFGQYTIRSTNLDSDVPKHIADKIQLEMRRFVGFH